jgi:ankyrin repeat protein
VAGPRKLTTRYTLVSVLPAGNYTHETEIVAKIGSKTASKWFKKFDADLPVSIKLYESYMQSVMRLLDRHQPKTVTVNEAGDNNVFVLSQAVPGYRSFSQVILDEGMQAVADKMYVEYADFAPKIAEAMLAGKFDRHNLDLGTDSKGRTFEQVVRIEGLAAIRDKINKKEYTNFGGMVMSGLFAGEIDLHGGNFGLDNRGRFVKIDGDWTLARLRYRIEDSWHANRNYNITPALIKSLPHLEVKDYQIHNYGNQVKQRKNTGGEIIPGIDPAIVRTEVNQGLLKILLTPNHYLQQLAMHEITNPDEDRDMQVAYVETLNRKLQTTISACEDPDFRAYLQTPQAKAYAQAFRDELATYKMTEKVAIADDTNQQTIMSQFKELQKITRLHVQSSEWLKKLAKYTKNNLAIDDSLVSPWLETPLHLAAAGGNIHTVNILLVNNADIHEKNSEGHTPIFYAARGGDINIFNTLIRHGADVTAVGTDGYTPLALAAGNGHLEIVKKLVVNVNQTTTANNDTALTLAAAHNHANVVEFLLRNNADLTITNNDDHIAFTLAAIKGHTETVIAILNYYKSINSQPDKDDIEFALKVTALNGQTDTFNAIFALAGSHDNLKSVAADQSTPLILAAIKGHIKIVDSILKLKPDAALLNATADDGSTALLCAAKNKHWNIVTSLLNEKNIDVNKENDARETVFSVAYKDKRADICARILEINGNIATFKSSTTQSSILHLAVECGNLELVKDLITRQKIPVNVTNKNGITPLQLAASLGRTEIGEFLLQNNADVNMTDRTGRTALLKATENLHIPMLDLLLAYKASVNIQANDGISALHAAAFIGRTDLIAKFIQSDPTTNVNLANSNQNTALHVAVAKDHVDTVKLLLDMNANVNALDKNGTAALYIAADHAHWEIAKLLLADTKLDLNLLPQEDIVFILHRAVEDEELAIVKTLVDKKVNLELSDDHGMSPLQIAVEDDNLDMVQLLIENGARLDHIDKNGNTPLLIAAAKGHVDIFTLLLAKGAQIDAKNNNGDTVTGIATVNLKINSALDAHNRKQEGATSKMTATEPGKVKAAGYKPGLFQKAIVEQVAGTPSRTVEVKIVGPKPRTGGSSPK